MRRRSSVGGNNSGAAAKLPFRRVGNDCHAGNARYRRDRCGADAASARRAASAGGLPCPSCPHRGARPAAERRRESATEGAPTEPRGSYIEGLQSAGLKDLTVDEIIALKIHGITPDYIRELRAAGIEASNPELVALKIHQVTPEYVRGLTAAGLTNLHVRDYLAAKIQGITPEFIQGIRSHGFKDLTLRQLIALKMADIS